MPKQIIIAEQHRIAAVFSEDQIEEIIVATGTHQVGDIYMGVVENILTSIDAAFVNIGEGERNGFIHITDLGPLRLRRSGGTINDLLAPQQRVLVQVMKEPTGNKGPRLTGNISMPGRYVVLMPFGRGVNLSRRIRSENERSRLRALAILIKPAGMGLLVRTEAEDMSEDSIVEDLDNLLKQWEFVQQESGNTRYPTLLDRDRDFIQRVLRDVYTNDVNRIVTDTSDGMRRVKQHLLNWGEGKIPTGVFIDHHRERANILEYFRVSAAIREALRPRVDLPSGGYIIIQPTEALTVIDVNSGSFTRSQTSRETVLWTNCEAATEVARQMRLRNIAGVIVVDFIDMDSRRDQLQLLDHFDKTLRADKSRPQIAQLTELGLVELTRKRQGQSIYELFGRPCPTCGGLGHLVHLPGESDLQPAEVNSRQWENRLTIKADIDVDDRGFGLSGGTEPNLVNHPSYQERSNSSRKRRRNAPPGRESGRESIRESGRDLGRERESRERDRDDRDRERPTSISLEGRGSRHELRDASPRLAVASSKLASGAATATADADMQVEPAPTIERSSKREVPRPKLEPPEIVTVEMTLEEQEVYAQMGISPLVFIGKEVKDPRNTIVSVVLPGETAKTLPVGIPVNDRETAIEEIDPEIILDRSDLLSDLHDLDETRDLDETQVVEIPAIATESIHDADRDANESKLESMEEPVHKSPEASRRRRRTSSAT
jgi:ribonuclease E